MTTSMYNFSPSWTTKINKFQVNSAGEMLSMLQIKGQLWIPKGITHGQLCAAFLGTLSALVSNTKQWAREQHLKAAFEKLQRRTTTPPGWWEFPTPKGWNVLKYTKNYCWKCGAMKTDRLKTFMSWQQEQNDKDPEDSQLVFHIPFLANTQKNKICFD